MPVDWICYHCDALLDGVVDAREHYRRYHPHLDGPDVILSDYGPDHYRDRLVRVDSGAEDGA